MFYVIIILAAFFAMPASAQSLKDQLVGMWTVELCNIPNFPACAGNNGTLVYDANGHYIQMIVARGRPALPQGTGANRGAITPEQYKEMAAGLFAQFGTWSVNETNKTVTLHVDGALFPNIEGTDWLTFTPTISGDKLGSIEKNGQPGPIVWRRISK
jgi:hypothetical protein